MENKEKRRIPLPVKVVLSVILLLILAAGGMLGKMQYEQSKMAPLETGEVIPGVYAVDNGFVNLYIVENNEGYLMIDAGNDQEQTSESLAQLGISPEDIGFILLTHSDSDHTSALSLFPNAEVYLPELEV